MSLVRRTAPLAFVLALAASTSPAHATMGTHPREQVNVPPDATVTISGHGYGHGHGMSQYGAEGAARQGLTALQIMRFYYPHTKPGTAAGPVTVHLTADTDGDTTIMARDGASLRDLKAKTTWPLPAKRHGRAVSQWRLDSSPNGTSRARYLTDAASDQTWHTWRKLAGDGQFNGGSKGLALVVGSSTVTYRGALQSRHPSDAAPTARVTVNKLPLDAYLQGVVPREMPALWHPAAVRAQAIAARTYAAYERTEPISSVYQICDTSLCQVYGGKSAEYPTSNDAVAKTAEQIRTYHDAPAFTQFSASNGGWSTAGSQPYLVAKADPYDGWAGNANHSWTEQVPAARFAKVWPRRGRLTGIVVDQRDGNGDFGGRAVRLTLSFANSPDLQLTGEDFRSKLALRSTWVDFSIR